VADPDEQDERELAVVQEGVAARHAFFVAVRERREREVRKERGGQRRTRRRRFLSRAASVSSRPLARKCQTRPCNTINDERVARTVELSE
jgi:hypothetical protein